MIFQNTQLHNVAELVPREDGDGYYLNRLPEALRVEINPSAKQRVRTPASAEIRFNLHQGEARIVLRRSNDSDKRSGFPVLAEIYRGDFLESWAVVNSDWTEIRVSARTDTSLLGKAAARGSSRFDPALVRVTLPHLLGVQLRSIEGEISPPEPTQVPATRYLAYGSSITQGILAVRSAEIYPYRVAKALGVDLINLGLGGGAHLESGVADHIAGRRDWNFASLELGINLVRNLPADEFRKRLNYFIPTIHAAHPDKWIFCVDLFPFDMDLTGNERANEFRQLVAETVAELNAPRVVHVSGPALMQDPTGLSVDVLHPSSDGFAEIGTRMAAVMRERMAGGA